MSLKKINLLSFLHQSLRLVSFFLLTIFLVIYFCRSIEVGDIWWHLSAGRYMLNHLTVPSLDPFTFAGERTPWIYNQWLGGLIYYLVFLLSGMPGLQIFRALLFVSIIFIFYFYGSKRLPNSLLMVLTFILAFGLATRCLLRPFVFNFLFVQLFLIVLFHHQRTNDKKWLWALPLSGIVWVNVHLGSLIYGAFLILIFLVSDLVQWIRLRLKTLTKKASAFELSAVLGRLKGLLLVFILYLLAFFVNPYGVKGALYPLQFFLAAGANNFSLFRQTISELKPPIYLFTSEGLWVFILLFLVIVTILTDKKNARLHMILGFFALYMFLSYERSGAFFAIVCAYIVAEGASHISLKNTWNSLKFSKINDSLIYLLLIVCFCANIIRTVNVVNYQDGRFQRDAALSLHPANPQGTLRLLETAKITGGIFNTLHYGGYIIWNGYPTLRPFVDGRQINLEAFKVYVNILNDPERFWPPAEKEYQFKIAMINFDQTHARFLNYLASLPDWQMISIKGSCVLFVKRNEFRLTQEWTGFEKRLGSLAISRSQLIEAKKKIAFEETTTPNIIHLFLNPAPQYLDVLEEGFVLWFLGYGEPGLSKFIEAFDASPCAKTRFALSFALKSFENLSGSK